MKNMKYKKSSILFLILGLAVVGGFFVTKSFTVNPVSAMVAIDHCTYGACPAVPFSWTTQEVDVFGYYVCNDAGYTIDPDHSDKCIKTDTRYANYSGNPSNKNCPSSDSSYTSTNTSKPCSRVVVVDSKNATHVDTTYKTVSHSADVQYEKTSDKNKCHRPSDSILTGHDAGEYGMTTAAKDAFKSANAQDVYLSPTGAQDGYYLKDGVCYPDVLGCTDPIATNYNSLATKSDGSCSYVFGCTDSTAFNYDPSATKDDGSCVAVVSGCTDTTAFNYNASANTNDGSCVPVIMGCTVSTAFNYNSSANTNDGSCVAVVSDCTDPTAFNYNPSANTDDGSCVAVVRGCTSEAAFNYNPSANTDDGSCVAIVNGCTDETAFNYNSSANTNDGSCVAVVRGCTDKTASNYNESANTDDGSCTYILLCEYNSDLLASDAACHPDTCNGHRWTGEGCPNVCEYNSDLLATDETCVAPARCQYNEELLASDEACVAPSDDNNDQRGDDQGGDDNVPTPTPTPANSGLGNFWAFGGATGFAPPTPPASQGRVLGATTCEDSVLLNSYIKFGKNNNPEEVKKLQTFLNDQLGLNIPVNGVFGPKTLAAVKQFQQKYADDVLSPWGLTGPTGFVFKTTRHKINVLMCPNNNLEAPTL
jgi:hypothetical protein